MREHTQNIAGVSPLDISSSLDAYKTLAPQKGVSFPKSAAPVAVVSLGGISSGFPVPSPVYPRFGKAHELTDVALAELVRQRFGVELGLQKSAAISATLPPQLPPKMPTPENTNQPSQVDWNPQVPANPPVTVITAKKLAPPLHQLRRQVDVLYGGLTRRRTAPRPELAWWCWVENQTRKESQRPYGRYKWEEEQSP
jgi:hypothetical protein